MQCLDVNSFFNALNDASRYWAGFHFVPLKAHIYICIYVCIYICPVLTFGYVKKVGHILISVDISRMGKTLFFVVSLLLFIHSGTVILM